MNKSWIWKSIAGLIYLVFAISYARICKKRTENIIMMKLRDQEIEVQLFAYGSILFFSTFWFISYIYDVYQNKKNFNTSNKFDKSDYDIIDAEFQRIEKDFETMYKRILNCESKLNIDEKKYDEYDPDPNLEDICDHKDCDGSTVGVFYERKNEPTDCVRCDKHKDS